MTDLPPRLCLTGINHRLSGCRNHMDGGLDMTGSTAFADKLAAKGVLALNVELQIAIAKFQNNGGSYGVALAILNAAYGKGKSASGSMPVGQHINADAPRTDAAKGRPIDADKARDWLPDAATERSAGRNSSAIAGDASDDLPVASPRNKPGHAKRGLTAIAAVQETVARSLFDTTKLPDGRSLREVHWAEVPRLAQRYTFLSRVMMIVHRKAVPADPAATLDDIVTEQELQEIIGSVEKINDLC